MDKHTLTRRQAIGAGAAGAALVSGGGLLMADGPEEALAAGSCVMTPELTIGPYFVEEKLNRSDVRGGQDGAQVTLTMNIVDYANDCAPVAGALVDIWHCNALGKYSDVQQNNTKGVTWLRGYQTTDTAGKVTFVTIFPGYYQGRATHIHVRVRVNSVDYTTQIFFTEEQTAAINQTAPYTNNTSNGTRLKNSGDNIYSQGGANVLVVTLGGDASGYTAECTAGIKPGTATDTATPTATATATATATPTTSPADTAVEAALAGLTVLRGKNGKRRLRVRLKLGERVAIAAKVTRDGKQLARTLGEFGTGTHTLYVKIPQRVKAGGAKVRLVLTDEAGNAKTFARSVHLPRKRA